jgi:DNA-binding IclR family transcriptional regulator
MGLHAGEKVSSMRNALKLLKLFTIEEPVMSLTELAKKLEIGESAVYRLISTLIHDEFITKDNNSKKFKLKTSLITMGNTIMSCNNLCHFTPPILEKLVNETGETTHLSILRENKVVYLQKFDCINFVHLPTHIGKQSPLHCTSSGQIFLAFQSEPHIEKTIFKGLTAFTSNTITTREKLVDRINKIKKQGYAFTIEEMYQGISSIAAPVISPSGDVVASISITGPITRINQHTASMLSKLVIKASDELSKKLKYKF